MSGGEFDFIQGRMDSVAEQLEQLIASNVYDYAPETIEQFKLGLHHLKAASIYIRRIDYLVSGDVGEGTFHKRLKEDLNDE